MNSEGWRVDPDGVAGVLAGVDDTASRFEKSRDEIEKAAFEGGGTLVADGRRSLASAWEAFLEERRLVPGKIMYAVNTAARAVEEATVVVVTGDEQMERDLQASESMALPDWAQGALGPLGLAHGGQR